MENEGQPLPADIPPAEREEHVRTRLLTAAVRVFDRKGYVGASVREVAELAGVTKPALYYHFGSKEGVLRAILDQAKRPGLATFPDAALGRSGSARERVVAFCLEVYGLFGQNVPVARVALAVFLGPPDVVPCLRLHGLRAGVPGRPGAHRRRRPGVGRVAAGAAHRRRARGDGDSRGVQRAPIAPGVPAGRPRRLRPRCSACCSTESRYARCVRENRGHDADGSHSFAASSSRARWPRPRAPSPSESPSPAAQAGRPPVAVTDRAGGHRHPRRERRGGRHAGAEVLRRREVRGDRAPSPTSTSPSGCR